MKKKLSRSILSKAIKPGSNTDEGQTGDDENKPEDIGSQSRPDAPKPRVGGAGSAWKSGAAAQSKAELERSREKLTQDILHGRRELLLDPDQITDEIGSDRREDWKEQEAFDSIFTSIKENGQDQPIHVWPKDPNWVPDRIDPTDVENVPFLLIVGRRRREVARQLGIPIRAILASPEKRDGQEDRFEMLFMRYRENAERENLGPFENLLSIGQMYEALSGLGKGELTAVSFAKRIGVHESVISRGRAAYKAKDAILNKFKNAYELSYPELQKAMSIVIGDDQKVSKNKPKPKKISISRKVGKRKLSLTSQGGKLTVSAAGLPLDKEKLEQLGDVIAEHLNNQGDDT